MNMDGDMEDLGAALNISDVDWSNDTSVIQNHITNTHCSALIKVSASFKEIYAGHTTWTDYSDMMRMFKSYEFQLSAASKVASKTTVFSGYPGTLSSVDDFYVLDTGLVIIETTNGVMNQSLFKLVTTQSVLSWIRVIVANRMAVDGKSWVQIFSQYNSGTYNNQWIVLDNNKLVQGSHLANGTLYILEQIPGYVEYADVTTILQFSYWPSYNIPFFQHIYDVSGFAEYAKKYGTMFTYNNNPRAEIFRRDAGKIEHISHMKTMLRYNNWKRDPLSHGNPGIAISSRFDLVRKNNTDPFLDNAPFGGVDSKVTMTSMVKSLSCFAQSGPTYDNQEPFVWGNNWKTISRQGLPNVWNFSWVEFGPNYQQS